MWIVQDTARGIGNLRLGAAGEAGAFEEAGVHMTYVRWTTSSEP